MQFSLMPKPGSIFKNDAQKHNTFLFFFLRLFLKAEDVIHVQDKTFKHFKRLYGKIIITTLNDPVQQLAF